jgi:hypothetical protein
MFFVLFKKISNHSIMNDRYLLTTTKKDKVTERKFKTFVAIAKYIGTSLNTTRQIFAYTSGQIAKPRKSIRTKNFYDVYQISEIVQDSQEESQEE